MQTEFCVRTRAGHVYFPRDLSAIYFEIGQARAKDRLPQLLILLEDVLERGVLIRLLLSVAVARLVLRVSDQIRGYLNDLAVGRDVFWDHGDFEPLSRACLLCSR